MLLNKETKPNQTLLYNNNRFFFSCKLKQIPREFCVLFLMWNNIIHENFIVYFSFELKND